MICTGCSGDKPESDYYVRNTKGDLRSDCKACVSVKAAKRFKGNKRTREAVAKASRKHYYMKLYGLTEEDVAAMYEEQCGLCALCILPMKKMCVDHCHDTGKVRGLLCGSCNTGLGMFKDNTEVMKRGIAYVKSCGRSGV